MRNNIIYHFPCPDGIFAALAAYLKFGKGPEPLRFFPAKITQSMADRIQMAKTFSKEEDIVYLVDFSGGIPFLETLCENAKKVIIIDHHKTAAADVEAPSLKNCENFEAVFDMGQSGATLALNYFNVKDQLNAEQLYIFDMIEDNDIWARKIPDSMPFAAGFHNLGLNLDYNENNGIFATLLSIDSKQVIEAGKKIQEEEARVIDIELKNAKTICIPYMDATGQMNSLKLLGLVTEFQGLRSVMGNKLASLSESTEGHAPAGAVVYVDTDLADSDNLYKVSLRGVSGCDTSVVSKYYGGGGHAGASSFNIQRTVYDSWVSN